MVTRVHWIWRLQQVAVKVWSKYQRGSIIGMIVNIMASGVTGGWRLEAGVIISTSSRNASVMVPDMR
jgi:hypothetical protein